MASRYWVGGTGSWDATTTHWSATSGGAGGATVPTAADDVFFNSASNATAYTCTLTTAPICRSITVAGPASGNVTIAGSVALSIAGSLSFPATGLTWTATSAITFNATTTGWTITTNGVALTNAITFNGAAGVWALGSAFTTSSTITLTNGSVNLAGFTCTCSSLITATGTKDLTFNAGTLAITGVTTTAFNNAVPTGFTTTAGTGTGIISMTGATAKTFVGGGSTYNCTLNQGGAGALTITGANTFNNITNTINGTTVIFPASTTTTFNNFNINGVSGTLTTLNSSTAGTQATISKASGTVSVTYLSIKDIKTAGTTSWYAGINSTNVSNNTGWNFTGVPTAYAYPLTNGSFAFTGPTAGTKIGRKLAANAGSLVLTGSTATLKVGRKLSATGGSFAVTGLSANGKTNRKASLNGAATSLSGNPLAYSILTSAPSNTVNLFSNGNNLSPDTYVELLILDASMLNSKMPVGTNYTTFNEQPDNKYYLTNSPPESSSSNGILYNGKLHLSFPYEIGNVDTHGDGTANSKPTLSVSNTNQFFLAAVLALGDLVGVRVTRIKTFYTFCDNGATPDLTQTFPIETWVVTRKEAQTKNSIQWTLSSFLDRPGLKLPRLQIFTDSVAGQTGFPGVSRLLM